jgi:Uma2 family endonuclease
MPASIGGTREKYNRYMATQSLPYVTPEQYLEFDRNAEFKHEYFFGEIVCMPGGSFAHNLIAANATGELRNRLMSGPCRVLNSDMRIAVDTKSGYVYPDVSVVCGAPEFFGERQDTITNPKLIVEVLSPSTSEYDLGVKFHLYLLLPALSDYVLIAQDRIWIEHWYRSSDGGWKSIVLEDPNGILDITSQNCQIPVSQLYLGVDLPAAGE